ncbi:hypothetical protein GW17_00044265 [Ensete ventricosum]|nr:hypothetical protein GW17_00044265 [Ensete ventricosum]
MMLQPDYGPRSISSIEPGFKRCSGISPKFAKRFTEGIGKLPGNTPGDSRKKTGRLATRIPKVVGLPGVAVNRTKYSLRGSIRVQCLYIKISHHPQPHLPPSPSQPPPPTATFHYMSCLGLDRQLPLPTKKAWRKLASKLWPKLFKIKRPKSLTAMLCRRTRTHYHRACVDHNHRYFMPVYVDKPYSQPMQAREEANHEAKAASKNTTTTNDRSHLYMGAASAVAASSSQVVVEISGVDLRAEMFIRKFKEEKKLERQRSFEEYREMMARGV